MSTDASWKPATVDHYHRVVQRAQDYIGHHLEQKLSLKTVARVTGMSPYHFHRIFHVISGETVNDFVHRLRLERAANLLLCIPDLPIAQVAETSGFSSSANFAKAFKLHFGVRPSQFRTGNNGVGSSDAKVAIAYGMPLALEALRGSRTRWQHSPDAENYRLAISTMTVCDLPAQLLIASRSQQGYEDGAIAAAWQRVLSAAKMLKLAENTQTLLAVAHDTPGITPPEKCRYDAALKVAKLPARLPGQLRDMQLPSGRYAVFHYEGGREGMPEFYTYLYTSWLPENGFYAGYCPVVEFPHGPPDLEGAMTMKLLIKLLDKSF